MEHRSDDHGERPAPGGFDGLGRRIAAEYAARPQASDEVVGSDRHTVEMILEEPWPAAGYPDGAST